MNEAERSKLYIALLRGLAHDAQDALCARDESHIWDKWTRYRVKHDDVPMGPMTGAAISKMKYRVRAQRACLNCGKEEFADG